MHYPGWWGYGFWMMWLLMVLFWIAGLVVIWFLLRWLASRGLLYSKKEPSIGIPEDSPQEILKRRYARGEIDREEYEQMKKDIAE